MSLVLLFSTFVVVWFLVFLMVLPWGNRPARFQSPAAASGAPDAQRLLKKAAATTVLSAFCVWGISLLGLF